MMIWGEKWKNVDHQYALEIIVVSVLDHQPITGSEFSQ